MPHFPLNSTGAGDNSGIGLDGATKLARKGYRVILACRSQGTSAPLGGEVVGGFGVDFLFSVLAVARWSEVTGWLPGGVYSSDPVSPSFLGGGGGGRGQGVLAPLIPPGGGESEGEEWICWFSCWLWVGYPKAFGGCLPDIYSSTTFFWT